MANGQPYDSWQQMIQGPAPADQAPVATTTPPMASGGLPQPVPQSLPQNVSPPQGNVSPTGAPIAQANDPNYQLGSGGSPSGQIDDSQNYGIPQPYQGPAQRGGAVKNLLTRMLYGFGQEGLRLTGQPTDYDIQKLQFDQQLKANQQRISQAQAQSEIAQREFQRTLVTWTDPRTGYTYQAPQNAMAKIQQAAIGGQYKVAAVQAKPQNLNEALAGAIQDAFDNNRDPGSDPAVQAFSTGLTGARFNDTQQFINNYLQQNNLPNTPQNWLQAHNAYVYAKAAPGMAPTVTSSTQTVNAQGNITTTGTRRRVLPATTGTLVPQVTTPPAGGPAPLAPLPRPGVPSGAPAPPVTTPGGTPGVGTYIPGVPDDRVQQNPGLQYLANTVPQKFRSSIYSMIEGRTPLPSASSRNALAIAQRNWAMQADPTLNDERYDLMKRYTNDKNLQAINTALSHSSVLMDAIPALNNGDVRALNAIANRIGVETGQTPAATFQTIVHRLGPELAKAYIANGGSAGERGADEADFDPSLPPQTLAANAQASIKLLRGALGFKEHEWKQNAAPWMDFNSRFLTPDAQRVLNQTPGGGAPPSAGGTAAPPPVGFVPNIPGAKPVGK